jgi:trk system potassium uptake protein TrkA
MKKKNAENQDIYCIIGLGRFGSAAAQYLAEAGQEVMVIDREEQRVREMRKYTDMAFVTQDLSLENLRDMGVKNCSTVIICIGEKIDVNVLTAMHAINLGVPRVIAKAVSAEHGELLEKIGVESIFPERDMAIRLGKKLTTKKVMEYIVLNNNVEISESQVPDWLVGKSLREVNLRNRYNVNVIALERGDKDEIIISIDPDEQFKAEDIIVVIGTQYDLRRFVTGE